MRRLALLLTAPLVVALAACPTSRTEGLDPSKLPENIRGDYEVFARRCSKCHTLARPLNAGITDDQQWVMYVNRMRRQPGSGISYDDQVQILRFLKWYAAEQRREKAGGAPDAAPPDTALPDAAAPDASPPVGSAPASSMKGTP